MRQSANCISDTTRKPPCLLVFRVSEGGEIPKFRAEYWNLGFLEP
jgi:hypothetical protein